LLDRRVNEEIPFQHCCFELEGRLMDQLQQDNTAKLSQVDETT
jgi:hypothetical protein